MYIRKNLRLLVLALPVLTMVSCSKSIVTVSTTANTQYVTKTNITQIPKLAFLSVDSRNKITGRAEDRGLTADEELLKEQAVYNALKSNNADVLVEPVFKVTTTRSSNPIQIAVEVTGIPGKYTDIRNITKEDEELVENIKAFNQIMSIPNSNILVVQTTDANGKKTTASAKFDPKSMIPFRK